MRPRKTVSVYVLLVGVMGLSIVGGILAFQIFSAATKSQLTIEQKNIIRPIDGSIDEKVIENLEKRILLSESEINRLETVAIITPSVTPTPTTNEIATSSATLITNSNVIVATESGIILEQ